MTNSGRAALLMLVFLGGLARPASADWLLTPYLGIVFGGAANTVDLNTLDDTFDERFNFGGSLAWMGAGVLGLEVDYSLSPNFFQITGDDADLPLFELDSSIQTLMGNVVIGIPVGGTGGVGWRPYAVGGIGLMRATIDSPGELFENLSTNELGINVGGGMHLFFSDGVGIRGDIRYFRGLQQEDEDFGGDFDDDFGLEDFDYWRATVGVTFRFGS